MSLFWRTVCWCGLAFVALLAGNAGAQTAPLAPTAQAVPAAPSVPAMSVVVSPKGAGINDVPLGVYHLPDSNIYMSGHQKGGLAGLLFGPVGMLAQGAVNAQAGKDAVGGAQNALRFDVSKEVGDDIGAALRSPRYGQAFRLASLGEGSGGPEMTVYAYAVITFVNDTDVRPYVLLKVVPKSGQTVSPRHTTRYICCGGEATPFAGDHGLTANDGEGLRQLLTREVDEAVNLMLTDIAHPYARDDQHKIAVEGQFPFVRPRVRTVGYLLSEDQDSIVFTPQLNNAVVFAGVEKVDKGWIAFHPATKKDPGFQILFH